MEEERFREKIGWFQFICCILVIWNHAGNLEMPEAETGYAYLLWSLERRIIPEIIHISIPCFLMLSGYLFYRGFEWRMLPDKWKRRAKSILIPYLLWNTLYYLGYQLGSWVPGISGIVNRYHLPFSAETFLNAVLLYQSNPPFWFMFQLILLTLLAPLLYGVLKRVWTGLLWLAVLYCALLAGIGFTWLNLDALIYYSIAAFAALHGRTFAEAVWSRKRFFLGVVLLLVGLSCSYSYYRIAKVTGIVLCRSLVPVGLWLIVNENLLPVRRPWMKCTFFLYAFHMVPVRLINKLALFGIPDRPALLFALYAVMPAAAIFVCWQIAKVMKRHFLGLWSILTGGR